MARKKKEKSLDFEEELKKLKPIILKEGGLKPALKEVKKEKTEFEKEETAEESNLEEAVKQKASFRGASWFAPSDSAPTLKSGEIPELQQAEPENLEKQMREIPASKIEMQEAPANQVEYVTKAVPKYEAGAGEYSAGRSYETFEAQKTEIARARERGMAGTPLTERQIRAPVLEERRAMNMAAWEVEHPITSRMAHQETQTQRSSHEEYVLGKKELHKKTKLPFEE